MTKPENTIGWHPADIKAALEKQGWNLAKISRSLCHADTRTASKVLRRSYPLVEKFIADLLQVHPAMIWPDRYHKDGAPVGRGIRGKHTTTPRVENGKEGVAA